MLCLGNCPTSWMNFLRSRGEAHIPSKRPSQVCNYKLARELSPGRFRQISKSPASQVEVLFLFRAVTDFSGAWVKEEMSNCSAFDEFWLHWGAKALLSHSQRAKREKCRNAPNKFPGITHMFLQIVAICCCQKRSGEFSCRRIWYLLYSKVDFLAWFPDHWNPKEP